GFFAGRTAVPVRLDFRAHAFLRDSTAATRFVCSRGGTLAQTRRSLSGGELFDSGRGRTTFRHQARGIAPSFFAEVRIEGGMGAAFVSESNRLGIDVVVAEKNLSAISNPRRRIT